MTVYGPGLGTLWRVLESYGIEPRRIIDESDFVLLVDEDELEELEKVGEDDALRTAPPALPGEGEEGEDGDGFFKKLFNGRRSSNRPQ